ncbi:MAG: flagellar hook-length control protein FliK [Desulfobulbaceae bacterium]|nr:flagellar hook-length control protein FliK [Desulfobulbaceae bacterium]HIJ91092.1 flagellar hook-length control protein FliK [Deltaproteobacteria bacterium]
MKIGEVPFLFKGIQPPASSRSEAGDKPSVSVPASLLFGQGQLLRGEVTGLTPDGKVILDIGGQAVEARSEVALKVGSAFWLEVRQTEPLMLRMADKKGAAQEFLRQYCADPGAMGKGLRALLGLAFLSGAEKSLTDQAGVLQNFAGGAMGPEADPDRIIRLLAMLGGGIAGENNGTDQAGTRQVKLHELIALLAQDRGGVLGKANSTALQKLGLLLELQSELNSLPASAQQAQFLLFPCLFSMGAGVGQWLFTLDRGDEQATSGEERGYALSFFLEMSRLGELQIQIRVKGQALQGECVVNGEAVREHLAPQLAELEELLGKLGYDPVHFSCRVAKVTMLESLKAGIEAAAQLESVRIIDLKA